MGTVLHIGKSYITRVNGGSRLCADITMGERQITLWFGVDAEQEKYLVPDRSDAFLMAMLPGAMRGEHDIVCADPVSERLHYQLTNYLIPTLTVVKTGKGGGMYHPVSITAPLTLERIENEGAVGTGFSGGVDCLYTIMKHIEEPYMPLTHIAVFNIEKADSEKFQTLRQYAECFAKEQGLGTVFVNSNMQDVLGEGRENVYSFRHYARAMALGRLFSAYQLSSGHAAQDFKLTLNNPANFDVLNTRCVSTESLTFYHSGEEATRLEKVIALSEWEPSKRWLHSCFWNDVGQLGCGHCTKCVSDMSAFYALGVLDEYRNIYDVDNYLTHLPERLASLMIRKDGVLPDWSIPVLDLMKERGIEIPPETYEYKKRFETAIRISALKKAKRKEADGNV